MLSTHQAVLASLLRLLPRPGCGSLGSLGVALLLLMTAKTGPVNWEKLTGVQSAAPASRRASSAGAPSGPNRELESPGPRSAQAPVRSRGGGGRVIGSCLASHMRVEDSRLDVCGWGPAHVVLDAPGGASESAASIEVLC